MIANFTTAHFKLSTTHVIDKLSYLGEKGSRSEVSLKFQLKATISNFYTIGIYLISVENFYIFDKYYILIENFFLHIWYLFSIENFYTFDICLISIEHFFIFDIFLMYLLTKLQWAQRSNVQAPFKSTQEEKGRAILFWNKNAVNLI